MLLKELKARLIKLMSYFKKYFFILICFKFTLPAFPQQLFQINNTNHLTLEKSGKIISDLPVSGLQSINYADKIPIQNPILPFSWVLKFTASGKVFKDVSFYNNQVGYIVTELGAVYKSTNGGDNWTNVMNLGFPYYWYGVKCISADTVIISGFNNQGNIHDGVVRWTFNGGQTWTSDIILHYPNTGVGWLDKVSFFDSNRGIVFASFSGGCFYTTNGGKDTSSWHFVQINSDQAWFAGNVDAQSSGNVYTAGIHFSKSTNFGLNWTSGPSADGTFDGGVDFLDYNINFGWTGGGQISSPVSGWVHRTTDGGQTWSARLNTFSYPIRGVRFFNQNSGFVYGGNVFQDVGGIFSTSDAGTTWNLDVSTSAEMFSMEAKTISDSTDLWCAGSTGGGSGYIGKLYKVRIQNPVGIHQISSNIPSSFKLYQNYPNPFNPSTAIRFSLIVNSFVSLKIYNVLGKEAGELINENLKAGTYETEWNSINNPSGIYFYSLTANNQSETKKMLLIK